MNLAERLEQEHVEFNVSSYWLVIARPMLLIGCVLVSALEYLHKVSLLPLRSDLI